MQNQQNDVAPREPDGSSLADAPTVLVNWVPQVWLRFMAEAEHNPEAFAAPEMPS